MDVYMNVSMYMKVHGRNFQRHGRERARGRADGDSGKAGGRQWPGWAVVGRADNSR